MRVRIGMMTALACSLFIAPQAAYSAGFAVDSQSATAAAMGGVGVANPDETHMTHYNPAMTPDYDLVISLGGLPSLRTVDFTDTSGARTDGELTVSPHPAFHASGSYENFGFGFGVSTPFATKVEYPSDWQGNTLVNRTSLLVLNFQPTVAYKLGDSGLSVSGGAQILWSNFDREGSINVGGESANAELSMSGVGFGGSGAIYYDSGSGITFGLTYLSAAKVEHEGDATFGGTVLGGLSDQTATLDVTLPHRLTLGIGYDVDNLWVGVDVGLTLWSSFDSPRVRFSESCQPGSQTCDPVLDDTDPPSVAVGSNWEDVPSFRFGASYTALDMLQFRAGIGILPTPVPDKTAGPSVPQGDQTVLGTGVGFLGENLRIDVAYQFIGSSRDVQNDTIEGSFRSFEHVLGGTLTTQFEL